MNLAELLAEYSASLDYKDLPENIVHEAKKRVIDSLGCAIGAFNAEPVRITRDIASRVSVKNGSTILGTGEKSTQDLAGFVNGTMVRYFDFNDTYLSLEP